METEIFVHLERIRRLVEEVDSVQLAAVYEQARIKKSNLHSTDRLLSEHFIRNAIDHVLLCQVSLKQFLLASREQVDDEISLAKSSSKDLSLFYSHVKQLKEFHKRNNEPFDIDVMKRVSDGLRLTLGELEGIFSGEEAMGRYLDLNLSFEEFLNLKSVSRVSYLDYLKQFDVFSEEADTSVSYQKYLDDLVGYLEDYVRRALPLVRIDYPRIDSITQDILCKQDLRDPQVVRIHQMQCDSKLYCNSCIRLFYNPNSYESHLKGKSHIKAAATGATELKTDQEVREIFTKHTCGLLESIAGVKVKQSKVRTLSDILKQHRTNTLNNIERRQAMTAAELAAEDAHIMTSKQQTQKQQEDFTKEHMDGGVYNPLKLPLDWDGKPIPLWLWKLHGLGVKYPCEVCGNYAYLGRKAFDQHFFEWRHAHGMRCLGVPNTKHFYQITRIEDVMRLWEGMRTSSNRASNVEEFEDSTGNVYNRKTYEDLKRQGLLH